MHGKLQVNKKGTLLRIFKTLFSFYPVMMPLVVVCILFSAIVSSLPSAFMQNVIALVEKYWATGDWDGVSGEILGLVGLLVVLYVLSLISAFAYTRMMAIITYFMLHSLFLQKVQFAA